MKESCPICSSSSEKIGEAQAFIRGLSTGMLLATSPNRAGYLRLLCLRHCNAFHEHEQWVVRNSGKPTPWPEEEPVTS